ncbi:MAG: hypothetical protein EA376_04405 [Phycisphaeraceae bacterium]|nr:MAG: hypothetical protein EA376_04405 [Phycisphaeraceae bacterium]
MHDPDAEAEAIIQEIYEAFRGVPRGEITLHEALVIDEYGTAEEMVEARKRDTDERWEEVPDEHVQYGSDALAYFDPVSWRYYIPRFMIWMLINFRTDDTLTSEIIIYSFDPCTGPDSSDFMDIKLKRFDLLSAEQSVVVCRFLRYMVKCSGDDEDVDALRALRDYWGRFCPESAG